MSNSNTGFSSAYYTLTINCSLDRFLTPRIEEYTSYLVPSNYNREEVKGIMEEYSSWIEWILLEDQEETRMEMVRRRWFSVPNGTQGSLMVIMPEYI